LLLGTLTSVDQGNARIPIDRIDVKGTTVHFEANAVRGTYDGTISADGDRMSGTWRVKVDTQGRTFEGDAKVNKAYFAYGQDAITVADAR
jgi:hypothetical protein